MIADARGSHRMLSYAGPMADSDFKSRNPVLNREFNDPARYATFGTQTADAGTLSSSTSCRPSPPAEAG